MELNSKLISWVATYAEAKDHELVALVGSDGFAEVAIKNGSALEKLGSNVVGAACKCFMIESNDVD